MIMTALRFLIMLLAVAGLVPSASAQKPVPPPVEAPAALQKRTARAARKNHGCAGSHYRERRTLVEHFP